MKQQHNIKAMLYDKNLYPFLKKAHISMDAMLKQNSYLSTTWFYSES